MSRMQWRYHLSYHLKNLEEYVKDGVWCVNCADPIYGFSANCNACSDTECTVNYL